GRARDGIRRPRRGHGPGGGFPGVHRAADPRAPRLGAQAPRAGHDRARARRKAVPPHHVHRRGRAAPLEGGHDRVGRRFRRRRGDHPRQRVRPPGDDPPLPAREQSLLYEGRPEGPAPRALRRRARAGGLWRNHRRRAARGRPGRARGPHPRARSPGRALRLVSRSPTLRVRPPRRLRHGYRTLCHLAMRTPPSARDDPLSAHARAAPALTHRRPPTMSPGLMRVWGGTVVLCLLVAVACASGAAAQDEDASTKRSRAAARTASTDERGFLRQLAESQRSLGDGIQQLRDRIDGLYGELAERKDEGTGLEQEVKELRDEVKGLYVENSSLKQMIESLKDDVQSVNSNVPGFRTFSGFFIAAMLLLLSVIFLLTIRR